MLMVFQCTIRCSVCVCVCKGKWSVLCCWESRAGLGWGLLGLSSRKCAGMVCSCGIRLGAEQDMGVPQPMSGKENSDSGTGRERVGLQLHPAPVLTELLYIP